MYHYYWWGWALGLLLLLTSAGAVDHNNISKKPLVQEFPQNYSSFHQSRFTSDKWMDIRVFVDTSLLLADPDACTRAGQRVRVGQPEGEEGQPTCSNFLLDDCWRTCGENDVLTTNKSKYINEIAGSVVDWLQSMLKVRRVVGNIVIPKDTVSQGCVAHLTLPEYYSKSGIPADLVLVVTGRPTPSRTVAWASECATDQTGRPVFGHINIGPGELENFENHKSFIFKVLLHEVIHVLGFNSYKFPFYTDSYGKPYASVTKTQIIGGKKITKIVTPGVLAAARDHFGCSDLDGVPLEDGGDGTTTDSHWEKRIFRNELMTGSSDQTGVISKITLSLLDDTGWYRADLDQAEYLEWGKGMGCNFVNGLCSTWEQKDGYFCGIPGAQGCTTDRSAMGACNLIRHKSQLPARFQYFPDPNFGGRDELSDYCPYVAAFSNGVCGDASNQPSSPTFGEHFGENSKCFESSLVKEGWTTRDLQPMCYEYRCVGNPQDPLLEVQVGTIWRTCPYSRNLQNVTGFTGVLACPDSSFCKNYMKKQPSTPPSVKNSVASTRPALFVLFVFSLMLLCY